MASLTDYYLMVEHESLVLLFAQNYSAPSMTGLTHEEPRALRTLLLPLFSLLHRALSVSQVTSKYNTEQTTQGTQLYFAWS